jgi:hypothetical protein
MTSEETIAQAEEVAADLAIQAAPEELLAGAADHECGPSVLATLLAHELAASHRLMQRIAAATDGMLDWSQEVNGTDEASGLPAGDGSCAELAAARLAGVAGRLMEQVRLGLVVLRRLRPDLPEDEEGIWLALRWTEDRCSSEELERRLAAAKAARGQCDDAPAPKTLPLSERAQALRTMALEAAAGLTAQAGVADLAAATAAERSGVGFVARLLTYELGAIHALTMRLAGCADRAFDRAVDAEEEPAVALQLSTVAARLGDRFRRGLLTLQPRNGGPDKPRKIAGMVWGGPEPSLAAAGRSPANDSLDAPAAAPAATVLAGQGVHRSNSRRTGRQAGALGRTAA